MAKDYITVCNHILRKFISKYKQLLSFAYCFRIDKTRLKNRVLSIISKYTLKRQPCKNILT